MEHELWILWNPVWLCFTEWQHQQDTQIIWSGCRTTAYVLDCGTIGGDEDIARQTAGKMKLQVKSENSEQLKLAHLLIKHPMNTGLQRDLVSQGYRPAFYISKIVAKFNDKVVFDADTYIGVSEDPNIQFPFKADQSGKLTVVIQDNEDKEFTTTTDVVVN